MIITIDGPVATGKSTIAKKLAEFLGYIYFDTGAMYRALTWLIQREHVDVEDEKALEKLVNNFEYRIKVKYGKKRHFVGDVDVTEEIRSQKVTLAVSQVSARGYVRERMVQLQRKFAEGINSVFEGRDMGTVVFPDASLKIFLTADVKERARRRFEELKQECPEEAALVTVEQIEQQIQDRDTFDSTRALSPLKPADDAVIVDTTRRSIDEVIIEILEQKDARKKRGLIVE